MAPQAGGSLVSRQRVRSISFDPADADRVDTLVELLREAATRKRRARRSLERRSKNSITCSPVARERVALTRAAAQLLVVTRTRGHEAVAAVAGTVAAGSTGISALDRHLETVCEINLPRG